MHFRQFIRCSIFFLCLFSVDDSAQPIISPWLSFEPDNEAKLAISTRHSFKLHRGAPLKALWQIHTPALAPYVCKQTMTQALSAAQRSYHQLHYVTPSAVKLVVMDRSKAEKQDW
jgi:hypothetical protein